MKKIEENCVRDEVRDMKSQVIKSDGVGVEPQTDGGVGPQTGVGVEPQTGVGVEPQTGVGVEPQASEGVELSCSGAAAGPAGWQKKFFTIAIGQAVSLVGSSAVQFALIWWLASETESPMMMAMSGLVAFLPQIILGPFAGVWIDRLKRKYVVIAADLFMGIVAVVFAAVLWTGHPPYWSALLILGVRSIGNVFHTPAIQSVIPQLVPVDKLVKANGWSQFMQSGAFMLGPVLGAALYAAFPLPVVLLTDFLGALVASITVAVVEIPEPEHNNQRVPHFLREMKEGAQIFLKDKQLLWLLIAGTVSMVFFMPLSSYYPLMSSSYFNGTAWHGSVVKFAYAFGMMGVSVGFGSLGKVNNKMRMAFIGLGGIAVTCFICGILPPTMGAWAVFAFVCVLMGGFGSVYNIPCIAYMQETIPPEAQGRAFSLIGTLMSLSMPAGLLLSSPVAEHYGVSMWFLIAGIGTALAVVLCSIGRARAERK